MIIYNFFKGGVSMCAHTNIVRKDRCTEAIQRAHAHVHREGAVRLIRFQILISLITYTSSRQFLKYQRAFCDRTRRFNVRLVCINAPSFPSSFLPFFLSISRANLVHYAEREEDSERASKRGWMRIESTGSNVRECATIKVVAGRRPRFC